MPKDFAIGLWTFDAGDLFGDGTRSWTKSIDERLAGLRRAAEKLHAKAADIPQRTGFRSIIAAPEYLFSNRDKDGNREPLPELDRMGLEPKLMELSRAFPDMVIVPGTIFYAKDLIRPAWADKKFNPATGLRDLPKTNTDTRRDKYINKTVDAFEAAESLFKNAGEREDVQSHGYSAGRDNYDVPSLRKIHETLNAADKTPRIVRNTAYILLNGKRIAKYDKQADFGEVRGASPDDMAFIPGTKSECPVVDLCRFGVEICYDHQVAALANRGIPDLRFHILVSDATNNLTGSMAMAKGGYFMHASTISSETAVFFRDLAGTVTKITSRSDAGPQISTDDLYLYRVTLPD